MTVHLRLLCLLAVSLAGCAPEPPLFLAVDLRTDLSAPDEIDTVDVLLQTPEGPTQRTLTLDGTEDLLGGIRLADFELAAGTWDLEVTARLGGTVRATRPLIVALEAPTVATVTLSRRCVGVTCPPDDAPRLSSCLAGRCVDPRCTSEQPEYCGESECAVAADCTASAECATPVCAAGVCLFTPDETTCAPGEACDVDVGCRASPGVTPRVAEAAGSASAPDHPRDEIVVTEPSVLIASANAFFRKNGGGTGWVAASLEVPEGTIASRSATTRETMADNHLYANDGLVLSLEPGVVPLATATSMAGYRVEDAGLGWGLLPRRFTSGYEERLDGTPIEIVLEEPHVLVASVWLSAASASPSLGFSREVLLVDGAACAAGRQEAVASLEALDGSALCVRRLAAGPHTIAAEGTASSGRTTATALRAVWVPERRVARLGEATMDATAESRAATVFEALTERVAADGPGLLVAYVSLRAADAGGFLDARLYLDGQGCGVSRNLRTSDGSDLEVTVACVRRLEAGPHELAAGHYHEGPIVPDRYELGYAVFALDD